MTSLTTSNEEIAPQSPPARRVAGDAQPSVSPALLNDGTASPASRRLTSGSAAHATKDHVFRTHYTSRFMRYFAFVAFILLAGCGPKTADETLVKDIGPAISWVATLQFAAESWMRSDVPRLFVRLDVDHGQKAFDDASKIVDRSPASQSLRNEIRRQLAIAHPAAEDLKKAVENDDRESVLRSMRQLASANRALQRLQRKESE